MMYITGFAGLQNQADFGPRTFPNQMMVHGRNPKQAWYRRPFRVDTPVAQNQECVTLFNSLRRLLAQVTSRSQPVRSFRDSKE